MKKIVFAFGLLALSLTNFALATNIQPTSDSVKWKIINNFDYPISFYAPIGLNIVSPHIKFEETHDGVRVSKNFSIKPGEEKSIYVVQTDPYFSILNIRQPKPKEFGGQWAFRFMNNATYTFPLIEGDKLAALMNMDAREIYLCSSDFFEGHNDSCRKDKTKKEDDKILKGDLLPKN